MKITPVAQGGNTNHGNIELGRTASAEKLAAAKAIAAGESPMRITESDTPVDPQVRRAQESVRKIKMKTQRSPERYLEEAMEPVAQEASPQSAIPDAEVEANATIEDTKPLSPQFAALAKQRRALQVKERELADREKALQSDPTKIDGSELIARLKSQPLSVLQEHGVTYDQLTDAILNNQDGLNPEIQALKAEIKALKEGVDQKFVSREEQAEEAALTEMLGQAESLAKDGDAYEMIRERNAYDQVLRLIHKTYKDTGRVLDVSEAMNTVETQLLEEAVKQASINKVRGKLTPTPQPQQQQGQRVMKTLTNRDGASVPMSAKARAVAAFRGELKR